jgi:hypothetical protein
MTMISNAVCGTDGVVTGLTGTAEITRWELDLQIDAQDATSMDTLGWEEYVGCVQKALFTIDTLVPLGPVGAVTGDMTFTNDLGTWSFKGIIEKISTKTDPQDLVMYTYTGTSTGVVTETLAG